MNKTAEKNKTGKYFIILLVCLLLLPGWFGLFAKSNDGRLSVPEYQIKAVYLYNFILFTRWPESGNNSEDIKTINKSTVTIGIVGNDPFDGYFEEVEGKEIKLNEKERRLVIKRFGPFNEKTDLSHCQLLFISSSEKKNLNKILDRLKGESILTVSDIAGFLESGGMLHLIKVNGNIRWEINKAPIERSGLSLSAQLLRNALRVESF